MTLLTGVRSVLRDRSRDETPPTFWEPGKPEKRTPFRSDPSRGCNPCRVGLESLIVKPVGGFRLDNV